MQCGQIANRPRLVHSLFKPSQLVNQSRVEAAPALIVVGGSAAAVVAIRGAETAATSRREKVTE